MRCTDLSIAESCYYKLTTSTEKSRRAWGRTCLVFIPLYQGKFERALKVLDDSIAADRMEKYEKWHNAKKHALKAIIYEEKKNLNLALQEIKKSMEIALKQDPNDIFHWQDHYAYLLAKNGDIAKCEEIHNTLKRDIEKIDSDYKWAWGEYGHAAGKIELAKGNLAPAITNFVKSIEIYQYFKARYLLSSIYLELGSLGEAVTELEKGLLGYDEDRVLSSIYAVKAYYLLGIAYEKSGWNKKAIEQYEEFLGIWKDADPGIPEVEDAKERLTKLKNEE